jgi:hypothetical protein
MKLWPRIGLCVCRIGRQDAEVSKYTSYLTLDIKGRMFSLEFGHFCHCHCCFIVPICSTPFLSIRQLSNMVYTRQDIDASTSVPQAVEQGPGRKPLPNIVFDNLQPVVTHSVERAVTPPDSPRQALPSTAQDALKQLFVEAIQQVLLEMPDEPTSGKSQPNTASLLTDLLKVLQATPSSDATTRLAKLVSVGVETDIRCQPPLEGHSGTPPNSPRIGPAEPATMGQEIESTDILVPSPDDPSAYSIYAEKPRGTSDDYKISELVKLSVTVNDIDAVALQDLRPVNDHSTPGTAAKVGQRLVGGFRTPKVEMGQSHEA